MAKSETPATSFTPWSLPAFSLPSSDGTTVSDKDLRGQWSVLFFYPADNTPTCTKEACAFSAAAPEFAALGARLYGLSKDGLKDHGKFIAKYGLKMPLLSDETTATIACVRMRGSREVALRPKIYGHRPVDLHCRPRWP